MFTQIETINQSHVLLDIEINIQFLAIFNGEAKSFAEIRRIIKIIFTHNINCPSAHIGARVRKNAG